MSPKAPERINIFIHVVGRGRRAFTSISIVFTILRTPSPNSSDVLDIFLGLHLNSDRNAGLRFLLFPL
ncbi:hypothetical protein ALC62_00548 [Cyphomyrmex costatus]|uniref:Uncharacterized protein n=1 Tax=Cyphomyrmex costatus TaxID=456900 RepID=A0A151IQU2_9HYME|nr:hypothetical protein ALC62_00548 [Cyphomyrmex costatus]